MNRYKLAVFWSTAVLVVTLALMGYLLSGCDKQNQSCYENALDVRQAEQLKQSLDIIVTKTMVRKDETCEWEKFEVKGTSFPIGKGYQLALTHATVVEMDYAFNSAFGVFNLQRQVKDISYFINGKEIYLIGRVGDISLFRKTWKSTCPFKLGCNPIVGTKVMVIGNSMLNGNNIKLGIVSALDLGRYSGEDVDMQNSFVHTVPTNGGDSGSPILAKNQIGIYEVVGIVNAGILNAQGYNSAIKINYIKGVVKKLMNTKRISSL